MSIPEQPQHGKRVRNQRRRRNAYHAMASPERQAAQDKDIACRLWQQVCEGRFVDVPHIAQPGVQRLMEHLLSPPVMAVRLLNRHKEGKPINVEAIRENYPMAYNSWLRYLSPVDKIELGIETVDEAALKQLCRNRELKAFDRRRKALHC